MPTVAFVCKMARLLPVAAKMIFPVVAAFKRPPAPLIELELAGLRIPRVMIVLPV